MLYNFQRKKLYSHLLVGGALCAAGFGMFSCSDRYDLDDEQPSGLSNIYGYMQEKGNFTNYLHLIDDLGQAEILSKTGSKTMFVADDDAFAKFYASNSWGVKSYDQLSLAQKKLLLNSSMIDNPYSTSMLSSAQSIGTSGSPVKGEVCRRSSSQSLLDSVMIVTSQNADDILPNNARFNELRATRDSIVLFGDASNAAPMLHFTGKFVTSNKLEFTDIDFIYNQPEGTFQSEDIYINNSKVIDANIFCKNGFIHQVDNVILPLDNMAEIIRKNPQMSIYSSIIERFAAPKDSVGLTRTYNQSKGTDYDSVFVKRYFSDRSWGSTMSTDVPFTTDKNGTPFDASLKFDPGWNGYVPAILNDRQPMMEDMAVMFVPNNAAMQDWWNNGGGAVVKDYYGTLENTPNSVLDDLINVNQIASFVSTVPSTFNGVLNDANERMGIKKEDIDSVYLGCNGLVYLTNKVFAPTSYSSVLFPAVIDTTNFKVIKNSIDNLNYDKYLNSMVSRYVFLLPTNTALLTYMDPVSYGQTVTNLWEFHLDQSKTKSKQLYAEVFECTLNEDGTWSKASATRKARVEGGTDNSVLKNRIEELLDNIIVTEPYVEGKKYYQTKGHTFVKVDKQGDDYYVSGSWQEERQQPILAKEVYEMENGKAIALDGAVQGARRSVAATLRDATDVKGDTLFSDFFNILKTVALSTTNSKDGWQAGDQVLGNLFTLKNKGAVGAEDATSSKGKATYLLNNFNYTVYAPTNAAMKKAYAAGLPTLEDLEAAEVLDDSLGYDAATDTASYAAKIMEVMLDFVKYHIQDNSIFIDKGFNSGAYESAKTELIPSTNIAENVSADQLGNYDIAKNTDGTDKITPNSDGTYNVEYYTGKYSPGRPYKLNVNVTDNSLTVNGVSVDTASGFYNVMAREYWYNGSTKISNPWTATLNNSSSVVIHAINEPLFFDAPAQFTYKYKPLSSE